MLPIFLSLEEVIEIHHDQFWRYGGSAGIRDMGLLQSAAAMPQASFGGLTQATDLARVVARLEGQALQGGENNLNGRIAR
jgi:death-on-curing protein